MAHRRPLDVGRHDANTAKFRGHLCKRRDSRAVDAIVVRHEDPHDMRSANGRPSSTARATRGRLEPRSES
jgi:hypothetical protein